MLASLPVTSDLWECRPCDAFWSGAETCWLCGVEGERLIEVVLTGNGQPTRRLFKEINHVGCPPPRVVVPGDRIVDGTFENVPGGESGQTMPFGHDSFEQVGSVVDSADSGTGADRERTEDVDT